MIEGIFQLLFLIFVVYSIGILEARKKRQDIENRDKIDRREGVADLEIESYPINTEETSEGMVPEEFWKEIADLTGIDRLPSTGGLPPTEFPKDTNPSEAKDYTDVDWLPSSSQDDTVYTSPDDHSLSHTEVKSVTKSSLAMSDREKSAIIKNQLISRVEQNLDEYQKPDLLKITKKQSVINILKHGGGRDIQRAVILSEVLGVPVALKNSNYESPI